MGKTIRKSRFPGQACRYGVWSGVVWVWAWSTLWLLWPKAPALTTICSQALACHTLASGGTPPQKKLVTVKVARLQSEVWHKSYVLSYECLTKNAPIFSPKVFEPLFCCPKRNSHLISTKVSPAEKKNSPMSFCRIAGRSNGAGSSSLASSSSSIMIWAAWSRHCCVLSSAHMPLTSCAESLGKAIRAAVEFIDEDTAIDDMVSLLLGLLQEHIIRRGQTEIGQTPNFLCVSETFGERLRGNTIRGNRPERF